MSIEESNMYFCHIENFAHGEINERSFSNPHLQENRLAILSCGLQLVLKPAPGYLHKNNMQHGQK